MDLHHLIHGLLLAAITLITAQAQGYAVPLPSELETAYARLKNPPSAAARNNIRNYLESSSSAAVSAGLSMLLNQELREQADRIRRFVRSARVDGILREWRRNGFIVQDAADDLSPIDSQKAQGAYRRQDDIKGFGALVDDRQIAFAIELRGRPNAKRKFVYSLNLIPLGKNLLYTLTWANSGFYIQEFNPETGTWIKATKKPRAGEFVAKGSVFEGKFPLRLLPKLPERFYIEAISWIEDRNVYDEAAEWTKEARLSDKYYNDALELLVRYADQERLSPDNALPLAQAIADAAIYRMSDADVREQIVLDGIASWRELEYSADYSFANQAGLAELPFPELVVLANRALFFTVGSNEWKLIYSLRANDYLYNRSVYDFLFLSPGAMATARRLIADYDLLVPHDLPATLRKIEGWLQTIWQYRADMTFVSAMYNRHPEEYGQLYEQVKYEIENGLNVVTTVDLDEILNYWNQSAAFQLAYIFQNGFYYGNCGDTTVIGWAMGKALGVPAIHQHYDAVGPNGYYQAVHSFPAYYSSSLGRYLGYSAGNNRLFEPFRSGSGQDRIFYYNETPLVIPLWHPAATPYPETQSYLPPNACGEIVSEDQWMEINLNGIPASRVAECMSDQLHRLTE